MDKTSDITLWGEIAWNGIAFQKPSCWEIATIGRNYLMLGTHTDPKMEITWGNPSRTASHHRILKQLQSDMRSFGRRKHGLSFDAWNPPQSWLDALPAHKTTGFSWLNQTGKVLIVSCASCNRTSLFQFYQSNSDDSGYFHSIVSRLLSTFRDHSENSSQKLAVFDIRATLPAAFQIKSYQFSPGFMAMDFFTKGHIISLYRWSPASVLLAGRKLSEFVGSLPFYPGSASETLRDVNRMEWEKSPSFSPLTRIAAFLSAKCLHHRLLIRHVFETNRILAVRSESRQLMDSNLFDQIVAGYETTAV
jgi:hypothetical protein